MVKLTAMRLSKAVLASFLVSVLTVFLAALAIFTLQMDPQMGTMLTYAVYVLSCLAGGWLLGRMMQSQRLLWGLAVGGIYFVCLVLVSLAAGSMFIVSLDGLITGGLCLAGGGLGGILS